MYKCIKQSAQKNGAKRYEVHNTRNNLVIYKSHLLLFGQ
jgi:hypothetical protein